MNGTDKSLQLYNFPIINAAVYYEVGVQKMH